VLSSLEQATVDQVTVNLTFTDAEGQTKRREAEPMIFALTAGHWKLIAFYRLRESIRCFTPTRIQRATVTRHPCTGHQLEEIGEPPTLAHSVHV